MSDDISPADYYSVVGKELWIEAHQDIKFEHGLRCDDLSRQIAVETGQAREIAPGIIEYKRPHIYFVEGECHRAVIGDKWQAEICREVENTKICH
jgi:hypothetical protein